MTTRCAICNRPVHRITDHSQQQLLVDTSRVPPPHRGDPWPADTMFVYADGTADPWDDIRPGMTGQMCHAARLHSCEDRTR